MTPSDVGRRVMLRRRVAGGKYSDVIGELLEWHAGRVIVRRRDGSEVTLAEADLVAGKIVPPAPARRRAAPHGDGDGDGASGTSA